MAKSVPPSLVLLTMVRNEAANMKRLLTAAIPLVQAVVIVDTGSTDNTINIATAMLSAAKLPHHIESQPWHNDFGRNRSQAFAAAQQWARSMKMNLASTYAVLVDGDHVLSGQMNAEQRSALVHAGYRLKERKAGGWEAENTRMLRMDVPWVCHEPTHEFWSVDLTAADRPADSGRPLNTVESMWVVDLGDGGCKSNKYVRDKALLGAKLAVEPNHSRSVFYMARTLRDMGDFAGAVPYFKRRTSMGGWGEEVYLSHTGAAECHRALGQTAECVSEYLLATSSRPHRAEAYFELAKHYRLQEEWWAALLFSVNGILACTGHNLWTERSATRKGGYGIRQRKDGLPTAKTPGDLFLVRPACTDHLLYDEASVAAFYVGQRFVGQVALDHVTLLSQTAPARFHDRAIRDSAHFYVDILPSMVCVRLQGKGGGLSTTGMLVGRTVVSACIRARRDGNFDLLLQHVRTADGKGGPYETLHCVVKDDFTTLVYPPSCLAGLNSLEAADVRLLTGSDDLHGTACAKTAVGPVAATALQGQPLWFECRQSAAAFEPRVMPTTLSQQPILHTTSQPQKQGVQPACPTALPFMYKSCPCLLTSVSPVTVTRMVSSSASSSSSAAAHPVHQRQTLQARLNPTAISDALEDVSRSRNVGPPHQQYTLGRKPQDTLRSPLGALAAGFARLRPVAGPIAVDLPGADAKDDAYLVLVQDSSAPNCAATGDASTAPPVRHYYRFLTLDAALRPARVSHLFKLHPADQHDATSLARHPAGFAVSLTIPSGGAHVAVLNEATVQGSLVHHVGAYFS